MATPFAVLGIEVRAEKLVRVRYLALDTPTSTPRDAVTREVCCQVRAYLADPLHPFDLPYTLEGSDYQQSVWREIARIPVGETRSYGELGRLLASAPRAIGHACGANPVPLIVPCHRVIAAGGQLGGFMHSRASFALNIKRWLLSHEAR